MLSKGLLSALVSCLTVVLAVLFHVGFSHSAGIFEIVTPHPGSELEDCLALAKERLEGCGPWSEDLMFTTEAEAARYRGSWGGCGDAWWLCQPNYIVQRCAPYRYAVVRAAHQVFQFNHDAPCHRIGQNIRMSYLSGDWAPTQYDVTIKYLPDPVLVADKNAGSCSGNCNVMVQD